MKTCPTCSHSVDVDANFCPKCGHGFVNKGRSSNGVPPEDGESQAKNPAPSAQMPRDANQSTRAIPQEGPPPPPPPIPDTTVRGTTSPDIEKHHEEDESGHRTVVSPEYSEEETHHEEDESGHRTVVSPEYSEEEEPTRVQPNIQDVRTERYEPLSSPLTKSEGAEENRSTVPTHELGNDAEGNWDPSSQRKWLFLGVGATLITLIGAIAMHLLVRQGDERQYPHSGPPTVESRAKDEPSPVVEKPTEETPQEKASAQPAESGESEPEKEIEVEEPSLDGFWTLDIEARLNSPEFGDMMEEEKNLLRSMMKKEGNKTAVFFGKDSMKWTETGKTTTFPITERSQDEDTWALSVEQPDGSKKTLKAVWGEAGLDLDDPFGAGTRRFVRQSR